jgi:hypothetical protein
MSASIWTPGTVVQSSSNVIDITQAPYNATSGTGLSIDTAVAAAVAELEDAGGGVIYAPEGEFAYSGRIEIPPYITMKGDGLGVTNFNATLAGSQIRFIRGTQDGRGGKSQDFSIYGANVATEPLYFEVCVERDFQSINVSGCAAGGAGVVLDGTQNCNFLGVHSQNNIGSNLQLKQGAGNNRFMGGEFSRGGEWNVKFTQSGASPSGAFTDGPTSNRFMGCILERAGFDGSFDPLASPDTALGTLYHGAGRFNSFISCDIELGGLTSTLKSIVLMEKMDPSFSSTLLNFHDINWSGTASRTTVFECRANTSLALSGRHTFENHNRVFFLNDTARVYGDFLATLGGVTTYFANQGGGVLPQSTLIRTEYTGKQDFLLPAGFAALGIRDPAQSWDTLQLLSAAIKLGTGLVAPDTTFARQEKYTIPGVSLLNGNARFIFTVGEIEILILPEAPTQASPNGSVCFRYVGGGAGTTLYVRESGAWVGK